MQNKDTFKNLRNYILGLKNQLLEMELENKEEYNVKLDLIYNKIKSPVFRIGFISTFSTGKSTIINALLGKEILPVAEKSTTGCITTITYGEEDKVEIILKDIVEARKYLYNLNKKYKDIINSLSNLKNDQNYYKPNIDTDKFKMYIEKKVFNFSPEVKEEFLSNLNNIKLFIEKSNENGIFSHLPSNNQIIKGSKDERKLEERLTIAKLDIDDKEKEKLENLKKQISLLEDILLEKKIPIESIKEYREENFNCNLISEIKIRLNSFALKENIELIDLPGVNVSNDNHINITKEMADKINAFIFIEAEMKTEGDLKKIAETIKQNFPKIYNYSYLLKNKIAYLKADERNFNEKMMNFEILRKELGFKEENTFKIDALKYLNKENLEEDYCIQFENFKNKLEQDSKKLIIKEFMEMIKFDTTILYNRIIEELEKESKSISYFDINDINRSKEIYIAEEINSQIEKHKNYIDISIEKIKDYQLLRIENENWEAKNNIEILEEIRVNEKINNYYLKKIKEGKDINKISFDRVFNVLFNDYALNERIRKIYYKFINDLFYNSFYEFLQEIFIEENLKYLPEKYKKDLKDIFNTGIKERLSGAIDIILYSYEEFREKAKSKLELVYNCLIADKDTLEINLEVLKDNIKYFDYFSLENNINIVDLQNIYGIDSENEIEICKKLINKEIESYLENDIKKDINKYTKAIIKNYIEDIIIKLENILQLKNYEAEYRINITSELKKEINERYDIQKERIAQKIKQKNYLIELYKSI